MEIERKFRVNRLPELTECSFSVMEQGYLNTEPVVRVRKEGEEYYLTYKGKGMMVREEYNLLLNQEAYEHLIQKADGIVIRKKRYFIPYRQYTIELDIFDKPYENLIIAEVEFPNCEEAEAFQPPDWFGEEVTYDPRYHNSNLSKAKSVIF